MMADGHESTVPGKEGELLNSWPVTVAVDHRFFLASHCCSGVRNHPLFPSIPAPHMDSLEARSRGVQERTFCKWSPIADFPSIPRSNSSLAPRQAEHETRIARVSTDDLPGQGPIRWRSAYSADGKVPYTSWTYSHIHCRKSWVHSFCFWLNRHPEHSTRYR